MCVSHSVMSDSLQPHGILQARILEWIAFSFSRGSFQPRDWTRVSCIAGSFFTTEREAPFSVYRKMFSFHTYLRYLGPVSCSHILSFLSSEFIVGRGSSLMVAIQQVFFSFLNSLQQQRAAIADSCDILVYWYGRKYCIPQCPHTDHSQPLLAWCPEIKGTLFTIIVCQ